MNRREETCSHMLKAAEALLSAATQTPDKRGVNGDWRDLAALIDTALRLARAEELEASAYALDRDMDAARAFSTTVSTGEILTQTAVRNVAAALRARATAVRAGKGAP